MVLPLMNLKYLNEIGSYGTIYLQNARSFRLSKPLNRLESFSARSVFEQKSLVSAVLCFH